MSLLELAEFVEDRIQELGGKPAFPCNVSVNHVAAHYAPDADDRSTLRGGDLISMDLGAHVDGYIADSAVTVEVDADGSSKLVECVNQALNNAIKKVKAGVTVKSISSEIERTILTSGFRPMERLCGHSMGRYVLHAGISVPNNSNAPNRKLKVDDVIAVEPFATDGSGKIAHSSDQLIYRIVKRKYDRMSMEAKDALRNIHENSGKLPFAKRWIKNPKVLEELISCKAIAGYRVLSARDKKMVAQAEHTLIVTEDGCEVITR